MAKLEQLEGIEKTKKYLTNLFKAKFPFIYIPTWEETRIVELINDIAESDEITIKRNVFVWSCTEGLYQDTEDGIKKFNLSGANTAEGALKYIDEYTKPAILILKDIHRYLGAKGGSMEYDLIRKIRDVAGSLKNQVDSNQKPISKNVVILAPSLQLPDDLQKDVTVVDFELPSLEELKELLELMIRGVINKPDCKVDLDENGKEKLCKAAQGLTLQEAENAFARAMVTKRQLTEEELDIILEEKCQVIKKTGILEFVNTNINIDDVGGLENMKKWLTKRNNSWLDKAQKDYNLPAPKGILITGIAGCGKSMTAKAMSAMWQLPLLRLDVGKIFSGLIGSSEENMRKAVKTAEAVAPSILWIDEIEKGFGGNGGERDGGTTTRVFGTFLTWMQEKTKPVFVIATANKINQLPAEMLRKGRFDEIFFVDLPTVNERKIIFRLHLEKRLKDSISSSFRITEGLLAILANETEGFGGSEIEQVVVTALFEAFSENRQLKEEDLFKAIRNIIPLSITQAEQIIAIREWAEERAVKATAHDEQYDNFVQEVTEEKKEQEKKNIEIVRRSRGGRTIDF